MYRAISFTPLRDDEEINSGPTPIGTGVDRTPKPAVDEVGNGQLIEASPTKKPSGRNRKA